MMSLDARLPLPTHYRDDDPHTGRLGELCDHSGTGDMSSGCPRGCAAAREHYTNDGHPQCDDLSQRLARRINALSPAMKNGRRHPADVTATRLGEAAEKWAEKFDAEERDMIGHIMFALDQIAEGRR